MVHLLINWKNMELFFLPLLWLCNVNGKTKYRASRACSCSSKIWSSCNSFTESSIIVLFLKESFKIDKSGLIMMVIHIHYMVIDSQWPHCFASQIYQETCLCLHLTIMLNYEGSLTSELPSFSGWSLFTVCVTFRIVLDKNFFIPIPIPIQSFASVLCILTVLSSTYIKVHFAM